MVQEIRSLQKLAIFFRVSRWGRRGGGGGLYAVLYGMCTSTLQVVFASTLLVVCSWGEGTCCIVIQKVRPMLCVSLFVGHAEGHSSLYGAFLALRRLNPSTTWLILGITTTNAVTTEPHKQLHCRNSKPHITCNAEAHTTTERKDTHLAMN